MNALQFSNEVMMDNTRLLWNRKSSNKILGESESSGSISSHSERYSDEQEEPKESPNGGNHSPDVTSKASASAEDDSDCSVLNAHFPEEVTSKSIHTTGIKNDGPQENNETGENGNIKNGDLNDGLKTMSERVSEATVNINVKENLVQQHADVAEEAIAGWEKAEKEVAVLKKQLDVVTLRNSALADRVSHLDSALKECVRQLRQTRDEQEENIHDAVVKKTLNFESDKVELENKLVQLQGKLDSSNARYVGMCQKVECLEKENMSLRHELQARSEELKIRTIEWDLSTQAAETASKQHLESIKRVAKLEAECRRLKNISSKVSFINDHKSTTSSSICVESITDSQSDSGEHLNKLEINTHKTSFSELNACEPSCSESWASALIAELDQFKNEKCRKQTPSSSVKIDLMDDFLEMEQLVALPETTNENLVQESIVSNQCTNEENCLIVEFEMMNQRMEELNNKLEKIEAEKAQLQIALMNSEECIEESQLRLQEAENKLDELQRELQNAFTSKQIFENCLLIMEANTQTLSAKFDSLEAEVDKDRALWDEIATKCKDLEKELEIKSAKVMLLEGEVHKERTMSEDISMKYKELEDEMLRLTASSFVEKKIKQEDLELAAIKLGECQKTIACLGNQLKSLATIEDFLIDTGSIPVSPLVLEEKWKLHSKDTFSTKRDSISSNIANVNKIEESSPPPSSSSSSSTPSRNLVKLL